ncbi:hypothetical protein [Candidatus Amarolinea dominans]|uniref:hypothetical protein n=1 Tax=Candidatus Amarolinea dominans TaxID=3140696 RepID=UPI003135B231|nr:hypothetical protein [Anaerolineae bacterium]
MTTLSLAPPQTGWISEYWEQGMEEMPWHIFQDERFCGSRTEGWLHAGIVQLGDGQHLTILNDEGQVMWAGVLHSRRLHWLGRRPTQPWNYQWHPLTVPAETWTAWFEAKPSYRAILRTNESL